VLTNKGPCKRVVLCFDEPAFPGPLPELFLRGPELLPVSANHQGRFFLLSLLSAQFESRFIVKQLCLRITPSRFLKRVEGSHAVPKTGNL
jgi:hypothetical protein